MKRMNLLRPISRICHTIENGTKKMRTRFYHSSLRQMSIMLNRAPQNPMLPSFQYWQRNRRKTVYASMKKYSFDVECLSASYLRLCIM